MFQIFSAVLFIFSIQTLASAQSWKSSLGSSEGLFDYKKKAEQKKGSRWTLQEWLETKERNRMMDLWLGMYAPSPYEFYLEGIYANSTKKNGASDLAVWHYSGRAGMSVLILGLEAGYKNDWVSRESENYGLLRLRVLGNAVQGTHLIFGAGQSQRSRNGINFKQALYTADLDVYVERHSGLHFAYRSFPKALQGSTSTQGGKVEAGLFFDLSFVQIFIRYFDERITEATPNSGTAPTENRELGTEAGLKLFF
jgi:hypothetical protein